MFSENLKKHALLRDIIQFGGKIVLKILNYK